MKTTKELIIADITAKVEAKLAKIKLAKHDIKLIGQITDYTKEVESIYSDMSSKAEILKKEYRLKTDTLQKPLVTLRAKIYVSSVEFLEKTRDLGIDGKSTTPYKQYEKLIQDVDKMNAYFVKEYVKAI
jgi:hypothetical protein